MGAHEKESETRGWSAVLERDRLLERIDEVQDPERTLIDRSLRNSIAKALIDDTSDTGPARVVTTDRTFEKSTVDEKNGLRRALPDAMPVYSDATKPNPVESSPLVEPTRVDAHVIPEGFGESERTLIGDEDLEIDTFPPPITVANMPRPDISEIPIDEARPSKPTEPADPSADAYGSEDESDDDGKDDALLEAPPIPAHVLRELGPAVGQRDAEVTQVDLAAQLGMAPEKPAAAVIDRDDKTPVPIAIEMAVREEGAQRVVELLKQGTREPFTFGFKAKPRNETLFEHLPRWLSLTESAAKIIPIIIAVFVLVGTLFVTVTLVRSIGGQSTEHVTLRFLPVQEASGSEEPVDPNTPPPLFTIETEPEGILVVLDRKILGATPITFELPEPANHLGVELSSPYYEMWIGDVKREPTGEMRMHAALKRKR